MKTNILDHIPDSFQWWETHEWVEFPVPTDIHNEVEAKLVSLSVTPEQVCCAIIHYIADNNLPHIEKLLRCFTPDTDIQQLYNRMFASDI